MINLESDLIRAPPGGAGKVQQLVRFSLGPNLLSHPNQLLGLNKVHLHAHNNSILYIKQNLDMHACFLLESWMSLNSHGGRIYMSPLCYVSTKRKWETDFSSMHIYNEAIWIRINILD